MRTAACVRVKTMINEIKQLKTESVYKDAYADRYRRLGYVVVSDEIFVEHGTEYCLLVLRRDIQQPCHGRLAELERRVDGLGRLAAGLQASGGEKHRGRKVATGVLAACGALLMLAGVLLVAAGFAELGLYAAFAGWAAAFTGALLAVVCSFLREKWRMRAVDIEDDKKHPGFGTDRYSLEIENCLKEAEELVA